MLLERVMAEFTAPDGKLRGHNKSAAGILEGERAYVAPMGLIIKRRRQICTARTKQVGEISRKYLVLL